MTNYYKYLPVSREDEAWGLYVLNAGCNHIKKSEAYPPPDHPSHHYFNWNKGRVFDEYQVIYITNGKGTFESESSILAEVTGGTLILLFPHEWHRFKPDQDTGWDEFWVGYKGTIAENLVQHHYQNRENAVLNIGHHESIIQLFTEIIEITKKEKAGYQPLVSGMVLHLLGLIHALVKQRSFIPQDSTESIINKARVIFRTHSDQKISMEKVAEELQVSYSWFRKAFKDYTGIAPGQYLLQLKIEKAKMMLSDPAKSVKEIALELNFESAAYFSKLFKVKMGVSPEHYRKHIAV